MKFILAILLAASSSVAQTASVFSFRNPHPIIKNSQVDLTPLFRWWVANPPKPKTRRPIQGESRTNNPPIVSPMPAYVHLTGEILKEEPAGWVVAAKIETTPGTFKSMKVFILNPPVNEKRRFDLLSAECKEQNELEQRLVESAQEERQAANIQRVVGQMDAGQDSVDAEYDSYARSGIAARRVATLRDQLKSFPFEDYRADFFAFQLSYAYEGLPAVDAGLRFAK